MKFDDEFLSHFLDNLATFLVRLSDSAIEHGLLVHGQRSLQLKLLSILTAEKVTLSVDLRQTILHATKDSNWATGIITCLREV